MSWNTRLVKKVFGAANVASLSPGSITFRKTCRWVSGCEVRIFSGAGRVAARNEMQRKYNTEVLSAVWHQIALEEHNEYAAHRLQS